MPFKDKAKRRSYYKIYYHVHPELKNVQTDRQRLRYWRIKAVTIHPDLEYKIKEFTEEELRGICKED
jgi:hypothetical protein